MFPIVAAELLAPGVKQFDIAAPRIARKQRPGQFVIIRVHESGERIPLTIKSSDVTRGTITLVVQAVGKTTSLLNELGPGDGILDVVGPLGKPSEIESYGRCVVIGGGAAGLRLCRPVTLRQLSWTMPSRATRRIAGGALERRRPRRMARGRLARALPAMWRSSPSAI
ncbi:MAG: FAD-binding oxidoreductase [Acidobacteriota bacterium]